MIRRRLSPTTHTLDMAQVAELNARLASHARAPVTAALLGMESTVLHGDAGNLLPAGAVLLRLSWEGSPEFPDIYAHFDDGGADLRPLLHTQALDRLSHHLGVRQRWGVGASAPRSGSVDPAEAAAPGR